MGHITASPDREPYCSHDVYYMGAMKQLDSDMCVTGFNLHFLTCVCDCDITET